MGRMRSTGSLITLSSMTMTSTSRMSSKSRMSRTSRTSRIISTRSTSRMSTTGSKITTSSMSSTSRMSSTTRNPFFCDKKCRNLTFCGNLRQNSVVLHNCNKNAREPETEIEGESRRESRREIDPAREPEILYFIFLFFMFYLPVKDILQLVFWRLIVVSHLSLWQKSK